ncbi:heterokaryon incompatibility protein-domain-containing protein [Xylaria bambusicola]|uniref:heterokaryon incompatibility protein-domain-containing protein n=1 Tax=Xylaria bambusicola TaxID=326684 RepID=UPI002008B0F7|nr:heterokaryon incompatibility protein-domain-containing protein [Xylaria bambusicola]KAI0516941.1 heterokaryon incompatibility protein-domain-containing protein [Xylaria bambusicola]
MECNVEIALRNFWRVLCHKVSRYQTLECKSNFYIEAWLYTSIFKAQAAMYSILPFPGPLTLETSRLPSRVLKLSESFPGMIHLIEPAPGQFDCYFALSHRWGASKELLLTRKTLKTLKNGILAQLLPRTFQDAVKVTNQFGCSYLWIDSLCILQDDIDDWLRESTLMANVYRQATCVIAAHSAQDDNEGFLSASRSSFLQAHTGQSYTGFHQLVNESGLSRRGWVFQERILSKRMLHFTSHHLFLEDASGINLVQKEGLVRLSGDLPKDNKLNVEDAFHNPAQWYMLVERYSHCELTCDIDRLPAITGLARVFKEMSGSSRFIFGLWRESLHVGLLWIQTARYPSRLRDAYRAGWRCPSWSWAAWKGSVGFPLCVDVLESCIIPLQDRQFQQDIMMLENLGPQNPMLEIAGKLRMLSDVQVICEATAEGAERFGDRRCGFVSTVPKMHGLAFFDGLYRGDKRRFERIWLLLIAKRYDKRPLVDEDTEMVIYQRSSTYYYLILEQADKPGVYRRIGTGSRSGANFWGKADRTAVLII